MYFNASKLIPSIVFFLLLLSSCLQDDSVAKKDPDPVVKTVYPYKFVNSVPVLNFQTRPELDKTNWTIKEFSSQQTTSQAIQVIDGKTDTA